MLEIQFTGFEQRLLFKTQPFVARIYEGKGALPNGFNVARISLDLSECSLLHWSAEILIAKQAIDKGLLILWELQFGEISGTQDDDVRFLIAELNMQHFTQTVLKQFQEETFGVSLFRGELNPDLIDTLKSLAALLPDEVCSFIFLDTSSITCPLTYFQSITQISLGSLHLFLKGYFAERYPFAIPAIGWGHGNSPLGYCAPIDMPVLTKKRIEYALLLPNTPPSLELMQTALYALSTCAFRVIAEYRLTQEWEGIDTLIFFDEEDLQSRSVKGFIAAGGTVVKAVEFAIKLPDDAAWLPPQEISQPFCPVSLR